MRARAREERIEQMRVNNPQALVIFEQQQHATPAPDDDNGGPYDNTLLPHFWHHIARAIWEDPFESERLLTLKYHASNLKNNWNITSLPTNVLLLLEQTQISHLAEYAYDHIDAALVSAFVERWQPETNTFHMPFGEMTVTLDDVKQILGVPLMGTPIHISDATCWPDGVDDDSRKVDWKSLMFRGIGLSEASVTQVRADLDNVYLTSLRQAFEPANFTPEEMMSEDFRRRVFRGWMLYMLGTVVFPNKSGSKLPVWLMWFLMDVQNVHKHAWGVAILAFLYRELGKASRSKTQQMAGCLPLLLCWIYEHFPTLRRPSINTSYTDDMPRLQWWTVARSQGNQKESLITYRHLMDEMDANHVIWDPYREMRSTTRPIPNETWYTGLLVYLDTIEPYYPERVLRQYGRIQTIPRNPFQQPTYETRTSTGRYELTFTFLVNQLADWPAHVLDMAKRSRESSFMSQCHVDYLPWFYRHSHPRIHRGELLFRVPMLERGVQQERHIMEEAMTRANESM